MNLIIYYIKILKKITILQMILFNKSDLMMKTVVDKRIRFNKLIILIIDWIVLSIVINWLGFINQKDIII